MKLDTPKEGWINAIKLFARLVCIEARNLRRKGNKQNRRFDKAGKGCHLVIELEKLRRQFCVVGLERIVVR